MVYQIWQFVAAGLYPHERKYITKYVPLSIALLIAGMIFVYFIVLPLSVDFFLDFSDAIPLPASSVSAKVDTTQPAAAIKELPGDPSKPQEGAVWFNTSESRMKGFLGGKTRVIPFGPENLASPMLLVDEAWEGRPRKLLLHGDRNGFFFVLDRTNGELLLAKPVAVAGSVA